jgi:hypothetical protein
VGLAMSDQEDSSAFLIAFLHKYTQLVEGQLVNIRETMVGTVESVMQGVAGISQVTDDKKQHAEKVLEATYLHPDVETEILIQDLQRVVDELFEETSLRFQQGEKLEQLTSAEPEVLVRNRIRRLMAKFDGDMNKLTQLDDDLRNTVFGIIGALSTEDVIAQKLEHVVMSLKVLQTGLNYVLIDYDQRCNKVELEKVISDIKNFTYRQYTTEDEKQRFHDIFNSGKRSA